MAQSSRILPAWPRYRRATFGWPFFLSIGANLAIGFVLLILTRYLDNKNAAAVRLAGISSELLELASNVVMELHPPGEGAGRQSDPERVFQAIKQFEALYWGKSNLLPAGASALCLTNLHLTFVAAGEGLTSSQEPGQALLQLQLQLAVIGFAMRESRDGRTSDGSGSDGRLRALAADCGRG